MQFGGGVHLMGRRVPVPCLVHVEAAGALEEAPVDRCVRVGYTCSSVHYEEGVDVGCCLRTFERTDCVV